MRKNILILSHNYATQFIDVCNQYVHAFDPAQFHVTVAYLAGPENAEARRRTEAEEVIFLDFKKKTLRGLKIQSIRNLLALCRERQFSLVVCHRYKPIYHFLWINRFCRIPAVFCVMHEMGTLKAWSRKILIALLAGKQFYFAGVSNAVRDDLRERFWACRLSVSLHCITASIWRRPKRVCCRVRRRVKVGHINVCIFVWHNWSIGTGKRPEDDAGGLCECDAALS